MWKGTTDLEKPQGKPWIKRIGWGILSLPFIIIAGVIVFEMVGMGVNHYATKRQTKKLERIVEETVRDAVLETSYSETGNTSGTGNHVDMLSVVVFRTEADKEEIAAALQEKYSDLDSWSFYVESVEDLEKSAREDGQTPGYYDALNLPEETENCYLVYVLEAAPFEDNIEGH